MAQKYFPRKLCEASISNHWQTQTISQFRYFSSSSQCLRRRKIVSLPRSLSQFDPKTVKLNFPWSRTLWGERIFRFFFSQLIHYEQNTQNRNNKSDFNVCCKSFFSFHKCWSESLFSYFWFFLLVASMSAQKLNCCSAAWKPFGFSFFSPLSVFGKRKHDSTCFLLLFHTYPNFVHIWLKHTTRTFMKIFAFGFLCSGISKANKFSRFAILSCTWHVPTVRCCYCEQEKREAGRAANRMF